MDWEKFFIRLAGAVVALVVLSIVGFAGTSIAMSIFASGKIDFCYIQSYSHSGIQSYSLMGFKDWRSDDHIGTFKSIDEAVDAASKLECPLSAKEGNQ